MDRFTKIAIAGLSLLLISGCSSNNPASKLTPDSQPDKNRLTADCACNDETKACCTDCQIGSRCSGGTIFATSSDSRLIAANSNDAKDQAASAVAGQTAADYCARLQASGFDDWRLPDKSELTELFKASNFCLFSKKSDCIKSAAPISDLSGGLYWSADSENGNAWGLNFSNGEGQIYQGQIKASVRCIRKI